MFEKNLRLVVLFDIYGALLTEDQRNMFGLYYNEDLSLAEIAQSTGLSRQGVRYAIKHAEEVLVSYEEKLGLSKKLAAISENLETAAGIANALKERYTNESSEFDRLLSYITCAGRLIKE